MKRTLGEATLKSGETLQIECVTAPDAERAAQIRPFLQHKPPNYLRHIEAAFDDQADALETRFYVGLLNGEMVGNIMTSESHGVGIFGHVHTREDQRRKGICKAIMALQMEDFRQRGGHVLLLGTGYESAPYWIYHSFGFRQVEGGFPGFMRYNAPDYAEFEALWFAPIRCKAVPAQWKHWSLVSLLAAVPGPVYLRSLTFGAWGPSLLEGPYCKFLHEWGGKAEAQAMALESETGAVVAFATLVPDYRWRGATRLLDFFAHPNVSVLDLEELLSALPLDEGSIQCYCDPNDTVKAVALEWAGFRRVATIPDQFREGDSWRDAWLYARCDSAQEKRS